MARPLRVAVAVVGGGPAGVAAAVGAAVDVAPGELPGARFRGLQIVARVRRTVASFPTSNGTKSILVRVWDPMSRSWVLSWRVCGHRPVLPWTRLTT